MNGTTSKPAIAVFGGSGIDRPRPASAAAGTTDRGLARTRTILMVTFGVVPIVAGIDKFTNLLVNWEIYLNPLVARLIPFGAHAFMNIVGVIEIAAGLLVIARPRLGGIVVTAWLTCIALSLITQGRYLDVAVRDLVMAAGAFTLVSLSAIVEREKAAAAHE